MSWLRRLRRDKGYRVRDFEGRERFAEDYRRLAHHLLAALDFDSAFDVGCANGFLLAEFLAAGRTVGGIELSPAVLEVLPPELLDHVQVGDFELATGTWDLVCCIEVAEHIPPERSIDLVAQLDRLARRWLYFSAAPPGQGGRGHINCRPHEEWLGWLGERGWAPETELTGELRGLLAQLPSVPWLAANSWILQPV